MIYDYSILLCIDISDGNAKEAGDACRFVPYTEDPVLGYEELQYGLSENRVDIYREAFTDPRCLTMSLGADRIAYHVGADGMLERADAPDRAENPEEESPEALPEQLLEQLRSETSWTPAETPEWYAREEVLAAIKSDDLAGEWVMDAIRVGETWVLKRDIDATCSVTISKEGYFEFYYYAEDGLQEHFGDMQMDYEAENFSDENVKGYTLYAYPPDGTFEEDYVYIYFRIAPFGQSLMVQKLSQSWTGGTLGDVIYYFSRPD